MAAGAPEPCALARAVAAEGNVVEFAALVEFEINEGSLVRARYPPLETPNTEESQYLCEQLLPDRSEGFAVQRTLFFMNRPSRPSGAASPTHARDTAARKEKRVPVSVYRRGKSDTPWKEMGGNAPTASPQHYATFTPRAKADANDAQPRVKAASTPYGELFVKTDAETVLSIPLTCECSVEVVADPFAARRGGEGPAAGGGGEDDREAEVFKKPIALSDAWAAPVSPRAADAPRRRSAMSPMPVLSGRPTPAPSDAIPEAVDELGMLILRNTGCGFELGLRMSVSHIPVVTQWLAGGGAGDDDADAEDPPFLYCLTKIKRRHDASVKRGAIMKGLAIGLTNECYVSCFEGVVDAVLEKCLDYKDESQLEVQRDLIKALYEALNDRAAYGLAAQLPDGHAPRGFEDASAVQCAVWKHVLHDGARMAHKTSVHVRCGGEFDQTFPVAIPYHVTEAGVCEDFGSGMLLPLLELFKDSMMTILNAILSRKRVIFLSYKRSADELCRMVMGAVSLVCPPFTGLLPRVFPYTSLTCMHLWMGFDAGVVVGVTNPMFEHRLEWWDVLCNIDTGKVTVNDKLDPAAIADHAHAVLDQQFITKLMAAVKQQPKNATEAFIRHHVREYVDITVQLAHGESVPGLTDSEVQTYVEANQHRVKRLISGGMLESLATAPPPHVRAARHSMARLRGKRALSEDEALLMFQGLVKSILTIDDVLHFLLLMPMEADGLSPLALGLYHPSKAVRLACVAFMRRIDGTPEGKLLISSLNTFLLLAYERCSRQMPVT